MTEVNTLKSKWNFMNHFERNLMCNSLRISLAVLFISIASPLLSQEKWDDLFPVDDIYFKNWGWHAAAGINYTIPTSGKTMLESNMNPDTISEYNFSPKGKVGAMLEGGAFYLLDNPIVSYIDGGIRLNWFNGKEDFIVATIG